MKKMHILLSALLFSLHAYSDDSEDNRKDKKFQLTLGPGIEMGIPAFSYTLGYYAKPNGIITLRYSDRYDYNDDGKKSLVAARLGYKKFVGNSFYYQPSVNWRKSTHTTTVHYYYESVGVGVRFGNEFQWENVVVGIDWIGVNHSLFKTKDGVSPGTVVPSSIDVNKKFTLDLIGIYAGYSF